MSNFLSSVFVVSSGCVPWLSHAATIIIEICDSNTLPASTNKDFGHPSIAWTESTASLCCDRVDNYFLIASEVPLASETPQTFPHCQGNQYTDSVNQHVNINEIGME